MRLIPYLALAALCACASETAPKPPPIDRFYYPTGLAFAAPDGGPGTLYVASSDFDKRYDFGALTAVDLNELDWPAGDNVTAPDLRSPWYLSPSPAQADGGMAVPNGPIASQPVSVEDLKIDNSQRVLISPLAGYVGSFQLKDSGITRLFVPSRAEGDNLFPIDASGASLSCVGAEPSIPVNDCTTTGLSLTAQGQAAGSDNVNGFQAGVPRAPEPYDVYVRPTDGSVFVTSLVPADSPFGSNTNLTSYLFQTSAENPTVTSTEFIPIGSPPSSSVIAGRRFAYVTGQGFVNTTAPLLRLVENGTSITDFSLENEFRAAEVRGIALSEDETRAYILTRTPDTLLIISVVGATTDRPTLQLVRTLQLPAQPNDIQLIPRGPGRGSLLAITCSGAGVVALYDDEVGGITTLSGVGNQPFAIAVDRPDGAPGARLFVSNFGDGRVAVVDLASVNPPYRAAIAAYLGQSQTCLIVENNKPPECRTGGQQ